MMIAAVPHKTAAKGLTHSSGCLAVNLKMQIMITLSCAGNKTRNPKHQIQNKSNIQNQMSKMADS